MAAFPGNQPEEEGCGNQIDGHGKQESSRQITQEFSAVKTRNKARKEKKLRCRDNRLVDNASSFTTTHAAFRRHC
ncbi:hypothetical protein MRB53_041688 [Persea americana]|nr:hypothetical protein MRB53_041688 [Persea americana]